MTTRAGSTLVRVLGPDRIGVTRPSAAPLQLAAYFSEPRTRQSWVDSGACGDAAVAERVFAEALERRVLVADEDSAEDAGDARGGGDRRPPPLDAAAVDEVARSLIGHLTHLRSCLATTDPGAPPPGEPALVLHLCHHLVRHLTDRVAAGQRARAEAAAAALAADGPVRLHLGCGAHRMPSWINVDLVSPVADVRMDVRDGLPFADGSAEAVYIAHLLEHLEYPDEAAALLGECARVLRPGAALRVAVPDIAAFARAYVEDRGEFFTEFERRWERPPAASPLTAFLHYAGAGEFPWVADRHRFGYDEPTLRALLGAADLTAVRRCVPGDSRIGDPLLDYSWANTAAGAGLPFTLIMEGEVPR